MKLPFAALSSYVLAVASTTTAFFSAPLPVAARARGPVVVLSTLHAEIRPPTEKNDVLEYGWDGTTALGKAVVDSKPARLLDQIRASGEVQSDACQLFNANLGKVLFFLLRFLRLLSPEGVFGRGIGRRLYRDVVRVAWVVWARYIMVGMA